MKRAAVVCLACMLILSSCGRQNENFEEILSAIDTDLLQGALKKADEDVLLAASFASSRAQWLSVLKRAYMLGRAAGTYEALYLTSKGAIAEISGAEEIAALCVFAGLRTGRVEMAYRYAKEYLVSPRWAFLKNEAFIKKSVADKGLAIETSSDELLLQAVFQEDPVQLARAADIFKDSRFALDASLRFAGEGQVETAASTIEPYVREYPAPATLLLYDTGRLEDAESVAASEPNEAQNLLLGDIYLKLKDTTSALQLYRRVIAQSPKMSWIPYVNSSLILSAQGKTEEALALVTAGKEYFPDTRQLLLAEIIVVSEGPDSSGVGELMDRYTRLYPADPEIAVVSAGIEPSDANRTRLESALWNAFLKRPEYSRTAGELAASLIASNDADGLGRLLDVWGRANGETAWSLFFQGYRALMVNRPEEAVGAFEKSYQLSPRWETAYNLSVLVAWNGDENTALQYLRRAESTLMQENPEDLKAKAFLRAATARILYQRGDHEGAWREALYALDLDPGSNEAAIILKLLETGSK